MAVFRLRDRRTWISIAAAAAMTLFWIESVGLAPIFGDLIVDEVLFWKPHPSWIVGVNRDNYRGPRIDPKAPKTGVRVACFGDSATFGLGVLNPANAYPGQLSAMIAAREGHGEAINFGVPGYTIVQGMRLFGIVADRYHPDVATFRFGVNEGKSSRTFLADSNRRFAGAPMYGGLLPRWSRTARLWQFLRSRWAPVTPASGSSRVRVPPEEFETLLHHAAGECRARDIMPVWIEYVLLEPDKKERRYAEIARSVFTEEGAAFISGDDLRAAGKAAFQPDGSHPNKKGHRIIAESLDRFLTTRN